MQYKVCNLEHDMKLIQNHKLVVIKRGHAHSVSEQDYQFLSQVYGMAVKGEKEYAVRITVPVKAEPVEAGMVEPVPVKKGKRKKK